MAVQITNDSDPIEDAPGPITVHDDTEMSEKQAGGGTLDAAYDYGGAGLGRVITADNGSVEIQGTGTYGLIVDQLHVYDGYIKSTSGDIDIGPVANSDIILNPSGTGVVLVNADIKVGDARNIIDADDNELMAFVGVVSAVNSLQISNAASTGYPIIEGIGDDSDVGINFQAKGAGTINYLSTATFIGTSPTIKLRMIANAWLTFEAGALISDTNGNELLEWGTTASAQNNFKISNAASGNGPVLESVGSSDANIDITVSPKGTGSLKTGNLSLTSNTIASTDTNGNILLVPDGTGLVKVEDDAFAIHNGTYSLLWECTSLSANRTITMPNRDVDLGDCGDYQEYYVGAGMFNIPMANSHVTIHDSDDIPYIDFEDGGDYEIYTIPRRIRSVKGNWYMDIVYSCTGGGGGTATVGFKVYIKLAQDGATGDLLTESFDATANSATEIIPAGANDQATLTIALTNADYTPAPDDMVVFKIVRVNDDGDDAAAHIKVFSVVTYRAP